MITLAYIPRAIEDFNPQSNTFLQFILYQIVSCYGDAQFQVWQN